MGNRAALWLLRLAIAQLTIGTIAVASSAANQRQEIEQAYASGLDGRISRLEDFRLDAVPRLAVLESLATDVRETRMITYGIVATVIVNLFVSAAQLKRPKQ